MALIVHRSNRAERLVDALVEIVREPDGRSPAQAETVVVQGRGMAQWLALELAQRIGIWANRDLPFPTAVVERILDAALGACPAASAAFQPEALRWRVAVALRACRARRELAPVRRYLDDDPRGVKMLQFAALIAETFDQYLVYRPDLIIGWDRGADAGDWQAVLWRALADAEAPHIARRGLQFIETVRRAESAATLRERFPRLCVFGVSTLPPLYLGVLAALASAVPVHVFVPAPTREYWVDVRSRRHTARTLQQRSRTAPGRPTDATSLHLDEGHPLLASLGRLGREFQELVEGVGDYVEGPDDLFEEPGARSMLAGLQGDMLALRTRGRGGESEPLTISADDASITIHACHGPMREVEVLHDQVLRCFEVDPTLAPHDVVVMCPDIDGYAPYIDAVFGRPSGDHDAIPYRISDRRRGGTDEVASAFFRLLAFVRPRATAAAVLDLLALEPIRERAGIDVTHLASIRAWVAEAGIRWGRDATDRAAEGQPAMVENTWQFGLDRLLLGYAMDGLGARLVEGVLPLDNVEGSDARAVGQLAAFCESLFAWRDRLRQPRPLAAWQEELTEFVSALLSDANRYASARRQLRQAIVRVAERATAAGYAEPLALESVQAEIEAEVERDASMPGFLTGPVTFCALVPLRSIPSRVVCLLGMNDASFPRSRRPPSFDRRAQHPQPGDRSPREDDRYLFLEALLAARERVIITYEGQSCRDNTTMPPSVVVSELLDVLEQSFILPGDPVRGIRDHVLVKHPLQPFSPRYFEPEGAGRLFSYSRPYADGAASMLQPRQTVRPFVPGPILLDPPLHSVTLDEVVRFFRHPVASFCRQRLRLSFREDEEIIDDREPIELDRLDETRIGALVLQHAEKELPEERILALVRSAGHLPLGIPGQCAFGAIAPVAAAICDLAGRQRTPPRTRFLPVDLAVGDMRLSGVLRDVWASGAVLAQYARLGGSAELEAWIRHLVLCVLKPPGMQTVSTFVGRVGKGTDVAAARFAPVAEAQEILEGLLALYAIGLEQPLPFFRKASRAFADAAFRRRSDPLGQARKAFAGDPFKNIPGDAGDLTVQRIFAGVDPLDGSVRIPHPRGGCEPMGFAELAQWVFEPLLLARTGGAATDGEDT